MFQETWGSADTRNDVTAPDREGQLPVCDVRGLIWLRSIPAPDLKFSPDPVDPRGARAG
jgi:hypothetical protein